MVEAVQVECIVVGKEDHGVAVEDMLEGNGEEWEEEVEATLLAEVATGEHMDIHRVMQAAAYMDVKTWDEGNLFF